MLNVLLNCISCSSATIRARYDKTNCGEINNRAYGSERWLSVKCGTAFTDILDSAEWGTKLTAGTVRISPSDGTLNLGEPSTETIPTGSGRKIRDIATSTWSFSTPSAVADKSDEDFWRDVDLNSKFWTFIPIDNDGSLMLPDDIIEECRASMGVGGSAGTGNPVAVNSPGFAFSITKIPSFGAGPNGAGKAGLWKVEGEFNHPTVLRSVLVPGLDVVLAAH